MSAVFVLVMRMCVEVDGSQTPAQVSDKITAALSAAQATKEQEILVKQQKSKQATNLVMGLYSVYGRSHACCWHRQGRHLLPLPSYRHGSPIY